MDEIKTETTYNVVLSEKPSLNVKQYLILGGITILLLYVTSKVKNGK